jgi:DNA replication protein DnaC
MDNLEMQKMITYPDDVRRRIEAGTVIPLEVNLGNMKRDCPNCSGIGSVFGFELAPGYDRPFQYPPHKDGSKWLEIRGASGWWRGKTQEYPCPACTKEGVKKAWLRERSGLSEQDIDITLSSFQHTGIAAAKTTAYKEVAGILSQRSSGLVTLYGGFGTGKTHLLKAVTNGMIGQGISARYLVFTEWISELRTMFDNNDTRGKVDERIKETIGSKVLCIDELDPDRINLTDWVKEKLFQLIDGRYDNKMTCLTVIATNVTPDRYPSDLGYLVSRLREGSIVEVGAPDMRPAKQYTEERERKDLE